MADIAGILFALAVWASPALAALVWARFSAVDWSKRVLKRTGWVFFAAFALINLVSWMVSVDCNGSSLKGYTACATLSPRAANLTIPVYVITYILLVLWTLGVFLIAVFLEMRDWSRRRRSR
jgi:hypothetical protein